jgi:AcrR family transcriptional regulator
LCTLQVVATVERPRRTQAERVAESTSRLKQAAIELIAEKGFERTTAAEIGERAGYSRNMVRDRYGSKEALLEALFDEGWAARLLPADRAERTGTGLQLLLGQLDDLLAAIASEPEVARAMIVLSFEVPGSRRAIRPWYEQLIGTYQAEIAAHLAAGEQDGSIRRGLDHAREAEIFASYAIGLCFRFVTFRDFDFPAELRAWRERLLTAYAR